MTSLPLISHRMFVEALGNESRWPTAESVSEPGPGEADAFERAVPLEVLDLMEPLPNCVTRRLRVSADGGPG